MSTATITRSNHSLNRKIVSISSKRQITIPQKFFTLLGFEDEAECMVKGNELIIRPARNTVSGGEFAETILADLISQGLSGDALLSAFKIQQSKVLPAVESMLDEAEKAASGESAYETYDDVFGTEE